LTAALTDRHEVTERLKAGSACVKDEEVRRRLAQRAHRDRSGPLLKELNLNRGLVQSVFKPCAEELFDFAYPGDKPERARVLDVGCGSAILARTMAGRFNDWIVHGFDSSSEAIQVAQQECEALPNVHVWVDDAIAPEFARGRYDRIFAQHLIQHLSVDDRVRALKSLSELLAPGGKLVVGVWCQSPSERPSVYQAIYRAAGEERKLERLGMEEQELEHLLGAVGLTEVSVERSGGTVEYDVRSLLREYLEGSVAWLDRGYAARHELLATVEKQVRVLELGMWMASGTRPLLPERET
jgi:SAM-dependent methyltransferase